MDNNCLKLVGKISKVHSSGRPSPSFLAPWANMMRLAGHHAKKEGEEGVGRSNG